jgi:hypothetical protein
MASTGTLSSHGPMQGRVRWRRFAAIFIPAFIAIGAMVIFAAQGALGVSFAISGVQFTVTADKLTGTGFEQFGTVDATASGAQHPVIVSAIGSATLNGLCQSVDLSPLPAFLKLTAGGSGTGGASADNLVVDATNLAGGSATFSNIHIGQDPTTFSAIPGFNPQAHSNTPLQGTFGQQADSVTISNLRQTAYATTAGTFTLPGLNLGFSGSGC